MINLIKKYQTFLKYIIVAGISFVLDITLFTIFNYLFSKIIIATILARVISSFINYLLNKDQVFKSKISNKTTLIKYYTLVVVQMFTSGILVTIFTNIININATFVKIPIEIILFLINYIVQKKFIFKEHSHDKIKK